MNFCVPPKVLFRVWCFLPGLVCYFLPGLLAGLLVLLFIPVFGLLGDLIGLVSLAATAWLTLMLWTAILF